MYIYIVHTDTHPVQRHKKIEEKDEKNNSESYKDTKPLQYNIKV